MQKKEFLEDDAGERRYGKCSRSTVPVVSHEKRFPFRDGMLKKFAIVTQLKAMRKKNRPECTHKFVKDTCGNIVLENVRIEKRTKKQ